MTRELFLRLVAQTTPNGFEYLMYDFIPDAQVDSFGNRYVIVGDAPHHHLFTCHLDTYPLVRTVEKSTIIDEGDIIRTDGTTLLGADDKAGMTVMLSMIKAQVPGIYGFFLAEEIGRLGSKHAANSSEWQTLLAHVKAIISFDRRGTSSIITHQGGIQTCSDSYANKLVQAFSTVGLEMEPDDTGSATDSLSFFNSYKHLDCTNISVGYGNVHSTSEFQDITFLETLCEACITMKWPI